MRDIKTDRPEFSGHEKIEKIKKNKNAAARRGRLSFVLSLLVSSAMIASLALPVTASERRTAEEETGIVLEQLAEETSVESAAPETEAVETVEVAEEVAEEPAQEEIVVLEAEPACDTADVVQLCEFFF